MTKSNDERNAPDPLDVPTGPRFTSNPRVLEIEEDMIADGATIENRARPLAASNATVDELRGEIEAEAASESPDRQRIAALNRQLKALKNQ